jgi:hypothetical protein
VHYDGAAPHLRSSMPYAASVWSSADEGATLQHYIRSDKSVRGGRIHVTILTTVPVYIRERSMACSSDTLSFGNHSAAVAGRHEASVPRRGAL